jgi:hypothetical protein
MWVQLPSGRIQHRFESVVLAATLALIPVLIVQNEESLARTRLSLRT